MSVTRDAGECSGTPGVTTGTVEINQLMKLRRILDHVFEEYDFGIRHYRLWRKLANQANVQRAAQRQGTAGNFWFLTLKAQWECSLFHLMRLFDENPHRNVSLEHFLRELTRSRDAIPETIRSGLGIEEVSRRDLSALESLKPMKVLWSYRGKILAHRDPEVLHDEMRFLKRCSIPFSHDVECFYRTVGEILDHYSGLTSYLRSVYLQSAISRSSGAGGAAGK